MWNPIIVRSEEDELRRLRDLVFGVPTTDRNWRNCREEWAQPEQARWLREQAQRLQSK